MMKHHFLLDEKTTFLNAGSFGACPTEIFEESIRLQRLLEADPVNFMTHLGHDLLKESLQSLASYIHCSAKDLLFVPNPSYAVNLIAKNIQLKEGDEVLSTNLEYGAIDRTWHYYCNQRGASYIQQPIQLPIQSKEAMIADFWKGYTQHTKVVFISQITSSTGLILPVKEICEEAKKRGLITIVDGAHVPGHIPLDLSNLAADFYTGACHKWMMTPKGSSFLMVKEEFQPQLDPLIISWGYNPGGTFHDYHQFNGTRDFSAYLTIPKSIEFMQKWDWKTVSAHCKEQVLKNAYKLFDVLNTSPLAPLNNDFFGQMCSAEITTENPEALHDLLLSDYNIQVPVMPHGDNCYIRFSYQAFNTPKEIDYLVAALSAISRKTALIRIKN
jgi:isopenicillin-N epimerase